MDQLAIRLLPQRAHYKAYKYEKTCIVAFFLVSLFFFLSHFFLKLIDHRRDFTGLREEEARLKKLREEEDAVDIVKQELPNPFAEESHSVLLVRPTSSTSNSSSSSAASRRLLTNGDIDYVTMPLAPANSSTNSSESARLLATPQSRMGYGT